MSSFTTVSRQVLQRWALGISLLFGLSLVITMTVVLGRALGGALLSYVTSLALVGALTVLVAYVIGSETTSASIPAKHDEVTIARNQSAA